ncbi:hypothetical protein [Lamprobacter modestohalophilus]|uniref:hypothetical protein n=1 Tax=Lamprobacter modestohalophilus TaxID=1064514 RepID=UPI001908B817|nr:hypothetical protein [Lamprobacter modestohalophilus]
MRPGKLSADRNQGFLFFSEVRVQFQHSSICAKEIPYELEGSTSFGNIHRRRHGAHCRGGVAQATPIDFHLESTSTVTFFESVTINPFELYFDVELDGSGIQNYLHDVSGTTSEPPLTFVVPDGTDDDSYIFETQSIFLPISITDLTNNEIINQNVEFSVQIQVTGFVRQGSLSHLSNSHGGGIFSFSAGDLEISTFAGTARAWSQPEGTVATNNPYVFVRSLPASAPPPTSVPVPASIFLLGAGLLALVGGRLLTGQRSPKLRRGTQSPLASAA